MTRLTTPTKSRSKTLRKASVKKPRSQKQPSALQQPIVIPTEDVLTLLEVAALLRVSETAIEALVDQGELPARRIGADLRFSKSAVLQWLGQPLPLCGNQAFFRMAGKFENDPFLEQIVDDAYRRRRREIAETPE